MTRRFTTVSRAKRLVAASRVVGRRVFHCRDGSKEKQHAQMYRKTLYSSTTSMGFTKKMYLFPYKTKNFLFLCVVVGRDSKIITRGAIVYRTKLHGGVVSGASFLFFYYLKIYKYTYCFH